MTWTIGALTTALDDGSFRYYCAECGREWRATREEEQRLRERIKAALGSRYRRET